MTKRATFAGALSLSHSLVQLGVFLCATGREGATTACGTRQATPTKEVMGDVVQSTSRAQKRQERCFSANDDDNNNNYYYGNLQQNVWLLYRNKTHALDRQQQEDTRFGSTTPNFFFSRQTLHTYTHTHTDTH